MLSIPAAGHAMSVADFLAKIERLKAKGMGAMFSPDLKAVANEMKVASADYRADLARAPNGELGCPPPKGQVKLSQQEVMNAFTAVPIAQRATTSVKTVLYDTMKRRFPCR